MELISRKGLICDFEAVLELKKQVHNFHYSIRSDFYNYSELPIEKHEFENIHKNESYNVFVVELNRNISGYSITKVISFVNNPLIKNHKRLFIDDICVDPGYRKMGIGKFILDNLETICKSNNYSYLDLNVWNFNKSAIEFHKKNGISETIIRMEKALDE